MTVSSTLRRAGPFATDGSQTEFAFTFKVFNEEDVVVTSSEDGNDTVLTFGSDYTVDLNADQDTSPGGTVTTTTALDGPTVTLTSEAAYEQPAVFTNNGGFYPRVLNDSLDRVVIFVQQLAEKVSRAALRSLGAPQAGLYLVTDADGNFTYSEGTGADGALRGDLAGNTGSALVKNLPSGTGAVARTLAAKLDEFRTFEDFGAVRYSSIADATAGTDSTAFIQAAIDWASTAGRSIHMTDGFFKCGNITMHNATTLLGNGRETCGFVAKAGTTGIWFDSDNAQKTILYGIMFYAADITTITRVCSLVVGQAGTEGYIRDCWFRNAPYGYGLYVDGNVYYIRNCTFESCKFPLKVLGAGNQLSGISIMQAGHLADVPADAIGLDIAGCFVRGLHVEATSAGALAVRMTGDCHLTDVLISNNAGATYSHIFEVDFTNYIDWSIQGVQILPNPMSGTITNGIIKLMPGATYLGGTNTVTFSGTSMVKGIDAYDGRLSVKSKQMQAFAIRLATTAGSVLQHRIGGLSGSDVAGSFSSKITGTSVALANTPTGAAAFVNGASMFTNSIVAFDVTGQVKADAIVMVNIAYNNTGTALTCWAQVENVTIDGVARVRLLLDFYNNSTGAAFNVAAMGASKIIEVQVLAFLA